MKYASLAQKYGFKVVRERSSAELNGTLVEMIHEKSGAQLIWLDNGEKNKLFSIGFKTLPEDSTGIFHILEHSTLCGSRKYPVREPFVELLKGSMNTFLNAITWPDKTVYPVASRNDDDYLNLMSVYMDAVFAPRFLDDPNILYQEGWHIEQNEGELSYKGVVFNEMKGAMSNEDELINEKFTAMLFPDNCYGYNSGGDPEVIPELTYEHFVKTYNRYYHPANSRTYLDGAIPLEKTLQVMDSYFSGYEKLENLPEIAFQQPAAGEETNYYEIAADQDPADKARLTFGKIISRWDEPLKNAIITILGDVLAGSNEAPLKKAVLDSGLAKSFSLMNDDSIAQPYFYFTMKDVKDGCAGELIAIVKDTAKAIIEKGLDRDELQAYINSLEFKLRDTREPAGLFRCFNAFSYWLHGGDPMESMCYDELFAQLRAEADKGGFEKVMAEMLLDERGMNVLHTLPSKTLGEEMRKAEQARLDAVKASWTEADWAANKELNEKLSAWQQTADTPEQLATLPMLELSAVSEEPELIPTEEKIIDGVKLLYHKIPSNGIVHINAYFKLTDMSVDELTSLAILPKLLGKLPTAKHSALELQQLVKRYVGRMEFSISPYSMDGKNDSAAVYLAARVSVLENSLPMAQELLTEILTSTQLDQKEQIRHIVTQADIMSRSMSVSNGNVIGALSAMAHYSSAAMAAEAVTGRTFIQWLHTFSANYDEMFDGLCTLMQRVQRDSFVKARLVISQTCTEEKDVSAIIAALAAGTPAPEAAKYDCDIPMRVGAQIPAQASFAVQGYTLDECGVKYDAGFKVGAHIMTYDYLWNAVRVQGGAYGVGLRVDDRGGIYAYSYRDPTPGRTLDVYAQMADKLTAFCDAGESVDKYILSTIAKFEPLLSPRMQGESADGDWFTGVTAADRTRMKKEMLATDHATLRRFADVLRRFAAEGAVCVIGHEAALAKCPELTMLEI